MLTQSLKNLWTKVEIPIIVLALAGCEEGWFGLLNRISIMILYLVIPIVALPHWKRLLYIATRNLPLLVLYAFVICSAVWSASPDRTMTMVRALLPRTLMGIYLATRFSLKEQMQLLTWVFGISALGSSVFGKANSGLYSHKNYLARMMAIGSILHISRAIDTRRYRLLFGIMAILSFGLLIRSQGKTALVLYLLTLCLLPLYWIVKRNYKFQVASLLTGLVVVSSVAIFAMNNLEFLVVDVLGKDLSFNGRTEVWGYLIERGLTRPWLGFGYFAFWDIPDERFGVAIHTWYGSVNTARRALYGGQGHAHSGYIDLFLSLGMIGIILLTISFLNVLWNSIQLVVITKKIEYFWVLSFTTFFLLLNFTITITILSPRHLFWIMYVSMALSTSLELERLKRGWYRRAKISATPAHA